MLHVINQKKMSCTDGGNPTKKIKKIMISLFLKCGIIIRKKNRYSIPQQKIIMPKLLLRIQNRKRL